MEGSSPDSSGAKKKEEEVGGADDDGGGRRLTNEDAADVLDAQLTQIRKVINGNKIKLWLPPFYDDGKANVPKLLELCENLSTSLDGMEPMIMLDGLKILQKRALDRLKAKEDFQTAGKIQLKLKLARSLSGEKSTTGASPTVEVDKSADGSALAEAIAEVVRASLGDRCGPADLRLICNGKVLESERPLLDQGVRPGGAVMVVKIDSRNESLQVVSDQRKYLESVKSDAELLGDDEGRGLSVADQSGKTIDIPKEERKSLIIAMSLHEKGRASLKKKDFNLALVFLLEADEEFSRVRLELLENVSNLGLLNLDIAWCYVQLGSLTQLDDAVARLEKCEQTFHKAYGPNMERLAAVKGTTGSEKALYLRMHVLQAIACYHSGDPSGARSALIKAKKEYKELEVPAEVIEEVKALGYSEKEARLALRATGGKVTEAAVFAQKHKEERKKVEKEEVEREKKRRRYGRTANGRWVNLGHMKSLQSLGYSEDYCMMALKQTDNDLDRSVDMITKNPDILDAAIISHLAEQDKEDSEAKKRKKEKRPPKEEALSRMVEDLGETLGDTDDHLDLDLEEEQRLIEKYSRIMKLDK